MPAVAIASKGRTRAELAAAELVIAFSTRTRDMGDYDVREPRVEISSREAGEDGFGPCLARSLPDLFDRNDRSLRGESWTQSVRFTAQVR